MVDFQLTEEQMMIRDMARSSARKRSFPTLKNGIKKALTQGSHHQGPRIGSSERYNP